MQPSQDAEAKSRRTNWAGVAAAFVGGLLLVVAGQFFALNGSQWDWWRWACYAGAGGVVGAVLGQGRLSRFAKDVPRIALMAVVPAGLTILIAALVVMSENYIDPYDGPQLWPRLLALVATLGFTSSCAALAALNRLR